MVNLENATRIFDQRQSLRIARAAHRAADELQREHDRIAHAAHAAINAAERHTQALAQKKFGSQTDLSFLGRLFDQPGIPTMRPYQGLPLRETSRPVSGEGRVSFHFESRDVTRGGVIHDLLAGRLQYRRGGREFMGRSVAHQKYVERDDAIERVLVRESPQPKSQAAETSSRHSDVSAHQSYIEREGAAEANDDANEMTLASWGTISEDQAERSAFWHALEEVEYAPSPPRITIDPDVDPAVWAKVKNDPGLPQAIRDGVAMGKREFTLDEDDAAHLFGLFADAGFVASSKQDPKQPWPVSFKLGRGGNVQTRMIIALPHEMPPHERLLLAKAYTARFEQLGIPFWAVIHAPGATNDARNFHLHINLATRPAKKIPHPETGADVWDFQVEVERVYANRTRRMVRPFAQNKLRNMNHRSWIGLERVRFAEIANQHLAAGGYTKRLDPRRYAEMGLPSARPYLDKNTYGRERRGLTTPQGLALAKEEWSTDRRAMKNLAADRQVSFTRDRTDIEWFRSWRDAQIPRAGEDQAALRREKERLDALISQALPKQDEYHRLWLEREAKAHLALRLASRARLKRLRDRTSDDHRAIDLAKTLDVEIAAMEASMVQLEPHNAFLTKFASEARTFRSRVEAVEAEEKVDAAAKDNGRKRSADDLDKTSRAPARSSSPIKPDLERSARSRRRRVIIARQKEREYER